jgi:hypothetical protein
MKEVPTDVVASTNVAWWAARQFVIINVGWSSSSILAKACSTVLGVFDTALTVQVSKKLMELSKYEKEGVQEDAGSTDGSPSAEAAPAGGVA